MNAEFVGCRASSRHTRGTNERVRQESPAAPAWALMSMAGESLCLKKAVALHVRQ